MKPKILFIMHMPPPVHGAAMVWLVSRRRRVVPGIIDNGKTGFLVPKHDVAALADKILFLLSNPDLRCNMGKAGRVKFEKEFTLNVFENRMTWILEHIVYPIFSRMGIERD